MTQDTDTAPGLPAGAVPLPGGNWVVLRSHLELTGDDVIDVLSRTVSGQGLMAASTSMRVALVKLLVTNWSFADLPLPATEAMQRRLPGAALVELFKLIRPAYDLVNGTSVAPAWTPETMEDPASPTAGSSE